MTGCDSSHAPSACRVVHSVTALADVHLFVRSDTLRPAGRHDASSSGCLAACFWSIDDAYAYAACSRSLGCKGGARTLRVASCCEPPTMAALEAEG
jgi:hypothetical protein